MGELMTEDKNSNHTKADVLLEGYTVSHKDKSEGFNLKVANQTLPPRPATQPVSHKKK